MKRTVKAWGVLDGTELKVQRAMPRGFREDLVNFQERFYPFGRVVPCTITYDDGRKAKPKVKRGKR
jgi:hypothetical protein